MSTDGSLSFKNLVICNSKVNFHKTRLFRITKKKTKKKHITYLLPGKCSSKYCGVHLWKTNLYLVSDREFEDFAND